MTLEVLYWLLFNIILGTIEKQREGQEFNTIIVNIECPTNYIVYIIVPSLLSLEKFKQVLSSFHFHGGYFASNMSASLQNMAETNVHIAWNWPFFK